ncbi:toll/interleukin-1 receptor domain-containing protein [Candidatus Villigracilis affinis]|uniref:toll/interleukin-1 receptor domain-containing protein n=1 Tax=Candidatus Villigracilis affinis TaxID=3140682 RepID=UPI002A1A7726|nr:toll/interleukin-1 receptor domain-containing protein [Anaerolineales bacterium]
MAETKPPKVFISYSWDDDTHKQWVRNFAASLLEHGVDVTLDRWETVPGAQLPKFMETAVRENDFVLVICTPKYKEKMDNRKGGVGYEGDIMTGEIFVQGNAEKFIPILRIGEWEDVAPSTFMGKYFIDLHGEPYSEDNYQDLLITLFGIREKSRIGERFLIFLE